MKAYNLPDISLLGFLDERITRNIVQYYYQTIGYGDYYSLIAEIGPDMSVFQTLERLAS